MKTAQELLKKAKNAKTAAELLELAKTENIELTPEDAEKTFAELHKIGELSDEELDNVSGGGCTKSESSSYKSGSTPKFKKGEQVLYQSVVGYYTHRGVSVPKYKDVPVTVTDSWRSGDVFVYQLSNGKTEIEPRLKKA